VLDSALTIARAVATVRGMDDMTRGRARGRCLHVCTSTPVGPVGLKAPASARRPPPQSSGRRHGSARADLGDSASDELLGVAGIRTPAFRQSARARGIVRTVAAVSVPAGWGSACASTRLQKRGAVCDHLCFGKAIARSTEAGSRAASPPSACWRAVVRRPSKRPDF
jgi:hypothetical protein